MRMFPIMLGREIRHLGPLSVPWDMIAPHWQRAQKNHGNQSLERLAERGGLAPCEALAILDERDWYRMDAMEARNELANRSVLWLQLTDPIVMG